MIVALIFNICTDKYIFTRHIATINGQGLQRLGYTLKNRDNNSWRCGNPMTGRREQFIVEGIPANLGGHYSIQLSGVL